MFHFGTYYAHSTCCGHVLFIPLSHCSRNAPRIHNVGHFFQIAKVPSGVCKFRPAFLLDSVTFVAIAKCSQMQLRVGELISFPPKFVSSLRTQHNKDTSVRIWYNEARTQDDTSANFCANILRHGWEWKECQTTLLGIIRPLHECYRILTNQRRIR